MEKKKGDMWSDREIKEMLSIIQDKHVMRLIDGKTKRNKKIFEEIASDLEKKEIFKKEFQIRNKFKSLKSDFYKTKRNNNKSGAKRQTCEHFQLLDEIFGHRPVLQAEGVDVIEMDEEFLEIEFNNSVLDESSQSTNKESTEEETSATNKSSSFKRRAKHSYYNVVKNFSNDWKETQLEMLQKIHEHDEKLLEKQLKKQEEMLEKNMKSMETVMEKDREETSKMLKEFLKAIQPVNPYMLQAPLSSFFMEPSSSNRTQVLKTPPQGRF